MRCSFFYCKWELNRAPREHPEENGGADKVSDFAEQNALTMAGAFPAKNKS